MLESSNAQALWGMIDVKPAFALDLFEAIGFHLPDHIKGLELKSGDVMLQLIIDPQLLREGHPAVDYILPACLTYIATYVHPRRVLWIIDRNNQFYNRLASNAEPSFELKYDRIKQVFGYNLVSNS